MKLFAVVTCLTHGYDHDKKQMAKHNLQLGDRLEVRTVSMGQSSTSIGMVEPNEWFNSVNFRFETEEGYPVDIYRDPRYNPYM